MVAQAFSGQRCAFLFIASIGLSIVVQQLCIQSKRNQRDKALEIDAVTEADHQKGFGAPVASPAETKVLETDSVPEASLTRRDAHAQGRRKGKGKASYKKRPSATVVNLAETEVEEEGNDEVARDQRKYTNDSQNASVAALGFVAEVRLRPSATIQVLGTEVRIKPSATLHSWLRPCLMVIAAALPLVILAWCIHWVRSTDGPEAMLSTNVYVKTALHSSFAFNLGWINCIMVLRYRTFATMMVGNTISMGVAIVCHKSLMVQTVEGICPKNVQSPFHFFSMIVLFEMGCFVHGFLDKKFAFRNSLYAPILMVAVVGVEVLEFYGALPNDEWDVYFLSPMYGVTSCIAIKNGIAGVPWASTGNMVSICYHLASYLVSFKGSDLQTVKVNMCLWVSFLVGITLGTYIHTETALMCSHVPLAVLYGMNDVVFRPPQQPPDKEPSATTNPVSEQPSVSSATLK